MKTLVKHIFFLSIILSSLSALAQHSFISSNYRLLNESEVQQMQIMIKPGIKLYNTQGNELPMQQLSLMTNPDYAPYFYVNASNDIKAIVFQHKGDNPQVIIEAPAASKTNFIKGEKAIDFITEDYNGNTFKLSKYKGKIVVLNFWFTRCGPCKMEIPDLNRLKQLYNSNDVVFLAITFDKKELIERFLQTTPFNFEIVPDSFHISQMYQVNSYPTTIVIDQNGFMAAKKTGYRTNIKEVLQAEIDKLL